MRSKRYKTQKTKPAKVSEPSQQYGSVATLEEIRNILREVALSSKETDRKFQETNKKSQESDRKLDTIAKMCGGISKNMGDAAEDFFFNGLSSTLKIGDLRYDLAECVVTRHER